MFRPESARKASPIRGGAQMGRGEGRGPAVGAPLPWSLSPSVVGGEGKTGARTASSGLRSRAHVSLASRPREERVGERRGPAPSTSLGLRRHLRRNLCRQSQRQSATRPEASTKVTTKAATKVRPRSSVLGPRSSVLGRRSSVVGPRSSDSPARGDARPTNTVSAHSPGGARLPHADEDSFSCTV